MPVRFIFCEYFSYCYQWKYYSPLNITMLASNSPFHIESEAMWKNRLNVFLRLSQPDKLVSMIREKKKGSWLSVQSSKVLLFFFFFYSLDLWLWYSVKWRLMELYRDSNDPYFLRQMLRITENKKWANGSYTDCMIHVWACFHNSGSSWRWSEVSQRPNVSFNL